MTPLLSLPSSPRTSSLLLIAVLHLGLLYVFLRSQKQPGEALLLAQGPAITWLRTSPPAPARPAVKPVLTRPIQRASKAVALAVVPVAAETVEAAVETTVETTAAPLASRAADILAQARRDVGKIDRDLRKDFPQQGGIKLEDTAYKRMQQGFADAYAAVPPKWYEASRIEEIGADLTKGVRVYKITSALGTLCITMRAGKSGESEIGMCPK